jgi:2-phosphosulfolactate phosphatase
VIDVALTPAELRPAAVAVVVDVLRATSTATKALASGYRGVICACSLARARGLRGAGRVLAGERACVMPPGFDLGNSPLELGEGGDRELVLASTNGAPAIVAAAAFAPNVLLCSLLNLAAVVSALEREDDVQIVCSGTDGAVALEDCYLAGRLSRRLAGSASRSPGRTDAALACEAVARGFGSPFEALSASADARVLRAAGLERDISYCALESELDVVPRVASAGDGTASVLSCDTVTV